MAWIFWLRDVLVGMLFNFRLKDFRSKRIAFYEELAKSFENREQFKTFLIEELRIASDPRTSDGSRAFALDQMYRQLSFGESYRISEILGRVMPEADRLMLSALDYTRYKPDTLKMLAESLRQQAEVISIIRKAVAPPLVLIPGIGAFCYVMSTISLPIMIKLAPDSVWSPFNMAVRRFCEIFAAYAIHGAVGLVVIVTCFTLALPRWYGNFRAFLEQLPRSLGFMLMPVCPFLIPLSIYRDFKVSLLFSSLAVLLQSGMTLTEALKELIPNSSPWLRWHINRILLSLQIHPTEYVGAFAQGMLGPKLLARLSSSIRHNPQFDRLVIKLGTTENAQVRQEIATVAKSVNAAILVALGGVIMFLYLGQFSISNDLADALGRGGR